MRAISSCYNRVIARSVIARCVMRCYVPADTLSVTDCGSPGGRFDGGDGEARYGAMRGEHRPSVRRGSPRHGVVGARPLDIT